MQKFHVFFNPLTQWTSLGLSLGWEEQNMVSTYHFYRFKYSTPMFGFCAQVAWTYTHIEYRHPE